MMAIAAMTDPTPAPRTATRRIEGKTGGEGHQDVDEPEDQAVDRAAIPAGEQPERRARDGREARGDEGDDQRDPRAIDETRKHVPAKVVRAEIITRLCARDSRRRQRGEHEVLVERVLR